MRMKHPCQDLPFHFEMAQNYIRIHPELENLYRGPLLKLPIVAFRRTDAAHPAFSDVADDLTMPQPRTCMWISRRFRRST